MTPIQKLYGRRARVKALRERFRAHITGTIEAEFADAALSGYLAALKWVEGGPGLHIADEWLDRVERIAAAIDAEAAEAIAEEAQQ